MSNVTNIILTTSTLDEDKIGALNKAVPFRGGIGLVSCSDSQFKKPWYGGDKHLEMNICVGACGELNLAELTRGIRMIEWEEPDAVQVYICGSDVERFTEVHWREPLSSE